MAYNQDSGLDFRPFRPGDFNQRTPIMLGGQASSPYHKGVADLAYNQLTLWDRSAIHSFYMRPTLLTLQ